jgi:GNAT superfamily N-acetyltransferase
MPHDRSNSDNGKAESSGTMANDLDHLRITNAYSAVHQLSDGTLTHLRLLRPDDGNWLLEGFAHLAEESRYRRFFTAMPRLPDSLLQHLLSVDGWNHLAIAAETVAQPPAAPEPLGIARFMRLEETPDTAEAAVAVVDQMQRRGLGKLLLSVLDAAARERGIKKFRAEVLNINDAIKALLHEVDHDLKPLAFDGSTAIYDVVLPDIHTHGTLSGPLLHFLRTAARGVEMRLRKLRAGRHAH